MKLKLSIWMYLFGIVISFAQVEGKSVPFVAYWSKGDSYDFMITKIQTKWKGDQIEQKDSTTYFTTFTVIDSTKNSYKINWKSKLNLSNLPPQYSELLNSNTIGLDFVYTTDELGEFQGIDNWKDVREKVEEQFNLLVERLNSNLSKDIQTQTKQAMKPLFDVLLSKQGIEEIVLKELGYFHFPFGVEFDTSEVIEYEDELPNFMGGKPLKADAKIYFKEIDEENGFCSFVHEVKINPEDSKEMVKNILQQMASSRDKEIDEVLSGKFDIQDYNYFEFYYYPGVPYFIETNRTAEVDNGTIQAKKTETIRIELLLD